MAVEGEETGISSRVIDETDYTQPTLKQVTDACGTHMGDYHINPIIAWQIKPDTYDTRPLGSGNKPGITGQSILEHKFCDRNKENAGQIFKDAGPTTIQ